MTAPLHVQQMSPVAIFSDTINFTASGNATSLAPARMQNPSQKPMWIDEVRFIPLYKRQVDTDTPIGFQQFGAYIYARLRVNRQQICDYTPIYLLSPVLNADIISTSGSMSRDVSTYIYRPPKPIYVQKYTNLQCDLIVDPTAYANFHDGAIGDVSFIVVYAGREIDDGPYPTQIDVPWVAKFIPPAYPETRLTAAVQSGANDLATPFAEPMQCSSMIGRVLYGTGDAMFNHPEIVDLIGVRMTNVRGGIIMRDKIPFGNIFDSTSRELKLDCVIDRQSYFIASIDADLRNINDGNSYKALVGIALHGYRTVSIHEYMG